MSYQDKKDQLKGLLKTAPTTPVQRIQPIKKDEKWHLNIWTDKDLEVRVKQQALKQDKSIKEIVIESIITYLERSERVDK